MRKLARIVQVDAIEPIPNADAIECAVVGGWRVVTKKAEFSVGDMAVYVEIDAFLPEGDARWQFLVEKSSREFEGRRGHVLRTVKLRGQISQGLLIKVADRFDDRVILSASSEQAFELGEDVSQALGIQKYEAPVPADLAGQVRGPLPSLVRKTDQERVQNLASEIVQWHAENDSWEITEKLEGSSCTYALIDGEFHVCSRNLSLKPSPQNSLWAVADRLAIEKRMRAVFGDKRNVALQGEMIGFGIQGNIYKLTRQDFRLFDIWDADAAQYMLPDERMRMLGDLSAVARDSAPAIEHVPVVSHETRLSLLCGSAADLMDALLQLADGPSVLHPNQMREGLVFKCNAKRQSFKAISNRYLVS